MEPCPSWCLNSEELPASTVLVSAERGEFSEAPQPSFTCKWRIIYISSLFLFVWLVSTWTGDPAQITRKQILQKKPCYMPSLPDFSSKEWMVDRKRFRLCSYRAIQTLLQRLQSLPIGKLVTVTRISLSPLQCWFFRARKRYIETSITTLWTWFTYKS